jgi:two-component system, sensor histidine kinase
VPAAQAMPIDKVVGATEPLNVNVGAGRGRRVLVIDDEQDLRDDLVQMLTLKGWIAQAAADEAEALLLAERSGAPDVVLADERLAQSRSGIAVIHALRRRFGPLPAVVVTGETSPEQIAAIGSAGLPVLHKPVEGEAVVLALQEALEQGSPRAG